jgi:ribosomal protein L19E
MNELSELSSLLDTLRARAERLRDLRSPLDLDDDAYHKAYKNLSRLETKLTSQLRDVEETALAAL